MQLFVSILPYVLIILCMRHSDYYVFHSFNEILKAHCMPESVLGVGSLGKKKARYGLY